VSLLLAPITEPLLPAHEERAGPPAPPPPPEESARPVLWAGRIAVACIAIAVVTLRPGPWMPLAACVLGLCFGRIAGWHGRQLRLIAVALATFASGLNYLAWRLSVVSLGGHPVPGWVIGVPLYIAEMHAAVQTMGLHLTIWPRHAPRSHDAPHGEREVPADRRVDTVAVPIFVFIPTVNEGPEILRNTLGGVITARDAYLAANPGAAPVTIVVCNDGGVAEADCSDDVIALCAELGVECVTRTVKGGAKAGNIENARQLIGATGTAFCVIFDADQIPREDFFLRTIPPFADPEIGWVQSGQFYGNRDNPVARWADDQQSLFYRLLCPGKAVRDAAFICGTNVALRAEALDQIGGLPTDCVTEDFAASIRLAPNWRSVYLSGVLAVGLGPLDLNAYMKQQDRWARGTLSVMSDHWRDLLLPGRGGLRAQQRLQYGLAVTHYLCGLRDLIFILAPTLFVLTGISGVRGATAGEFLSYFVPYYVIALAGFWYAAYPVTSWRSIVIGYGSFPALLHALVMLVIGKRGGFTITPKWRTKTNIWRESWMHLVIVAGCTATLILMLFVRHGSAYWLAAFWLFYLDVMSGAYLLLVAQDDRSARKAARDAEAGIVPEPVPWNPRPDPHEKQQRRIRPARTARAAVAGGSGRWRTRLALTAAVAVAAGSGALVLAEQPALAVNAGPAPAPDHPYVGMSAVDDDRAAMQATTGVRFGIVGRTMETDASFDTAWADALAKQGTVPWLTLSFTHNGRGTLNSSLTAIRNGADDAQIRAWAEQIAAYGKPVYLSFMPDVDRNYLPTSAVANGGIPQDVAPAWDRLRRIFAAAGATNAAWVWDPADAAHDQLYSPPAAQIDAVGVILFEYPGQKWPDPATELAAVAARHPGKPLLVEAAVSGPGKQRAAWLEALGAAMADRADIAGFVYHETGPVIGGGAAAAAWSVDADPATLAAYQGIARDLAAARTGTAQ
jgi:cellulose synthase/poly-beta-1,6-N-acetylglucosamine synthase-like glycosyltransferase